MNTVVRSIILIFFILMWVLYMYCVLKPRPMKSQDSQNSESFDYEYKHNVSKCDKPPGYHRYQSNTCDSTQDKLPITMPDPNEGISPAIGDPLIMNMMYGLM